MTNYKINCSLSPNTHANLYSRGMLKTYMKTNKLILFFIVIFFLSLAFVTFFVKLAFAYDYQIIELETFGGRDSDAIDINDAGYVVGSADANVNEPHACLWINGKANNLGFRTAEGINNKNQIVGSNDAIPGNAVLWERNKITVLDKGQSDAIKINDDGQIVGHTSPSLRYWNATLWNGEIVTDLTYPLNDRSSIANSINNNGEIVGFSSLTYDKLRHATLWRNGKAILLNDLKDIESEAFDTNNSGDVVGGIRKEDGKDYAILWSKGKDKILGKGTAWGINDKGVVVGFSSSGNQRALMWVNGVEIELKSLIDPKLGWDLKRANAINNSGQIVGTGHFNGHFRGFLMTPRKTAN